MHMLLCLFFKRFNFCKMLTGNKKTVTVTKTSGFFSQFMYFPLSLETSEQNELSKLNWTCLRKLRTHMKVRELDHLPIGDRDQVSSVKHVKNSVELWRDGEIWKHVESRCDGIINVFQSFNQAASLSLEDRSVADQPSGQLRNLVFV